MMQGLVCDDAQVRKAVFIYVCVNMHLAPIWATKINRGSSRTGAY